MLALFLFLLIPNTAFSLSTTITYLADIFIELSTTNPTSHSWSVLPNSNPMNVYVKLGIFLVLFPSLYTSFSSEPYFILLLPVPSVPEVFIVHLSWSFSSGRYWGNAQTWSLLICASDHWWRSSVLLVQRVLLWERKNVHFLNRTFKQKWITLAQTRKTDHTIHPLHSPRMLNRSIKKETQEENELHFQMGYHLRENVFLFRKLSEVAEQKRKEMM